MNRYKTPGSNYKVGKASRKEMNMLYIFKTKIVPVSDPAPYSFQVQPLLFLLFSL
jgi:hypothetical protein